MLAKIKNFFRPRRKSVRTLDKLSPAERQKYKNLIPNLFGEFIEEVPLEKKRSNSFNKTNIKLTLDLNPFNYSISGELIKKKIQNQNNANSRTSLQRNYFIGSLQKRNRILSSKNIRRGSFEKKIVGKKKERIDRIITVQPGKKENDNPNFFQRSLKKKKTIDPQDTVIAEHLSFKITEKEIKETKEKLEEYQEKMRKTQLRYYVFKKITNYKSSLRMAFHKYRSIVQLMEALNEKNDDIKETKEENKKENDIELLKKRTKILKNVLKNRSFKEQKELNKYFIKFYYNSKFAVKMENLNKTSSDNATSYTSNTAENNSNNINTNNDNFLDVLGNEIKKEEKKELTPEEIEKEKRKRNKELRDLFYNKVRERQKWLHDHFVKFYYKGLLWAMKTGNIKNNTSSSSSNDTNNASTNNNNTSNVNNENATQSTTTTTNDQPAEINLDNKTSSEIDTININKEIEKKEVEKKEEEKKDENNDQKAKVRNLRDRSKGLRRLLSERNKEKTNLLRKYFSKFLSNGILLSLKKTTLRSTKSLIEVDIENPENKSEEKKDEKEESNWIIEEKKRRKQEEEQKERELKEKINQKLVVIFNKKDQIICSRLRSCLQKWNLRAKIMGISDLTGGVRKSKRAKGKKKNKKKEDKKDEEKKEENNENNENK